MTAAKGVRSLVRAAETTNVITVEMWNEVLIHRSQLMIECVYSVYQPRPLGLDTSTQTDLTWTLASSLDTSLDT